MCVLDGPRLARSVPSPEARSPDERSGFLVWVSRGHGRKLLTHARYEDARKTRKPERRFLRVVKARGLALVPQAPPMPGSNANYPAMCKQVGPAGYTLSPRAGQQKRSLVEPIVEHTHTHTHRMTSGCRKKKKKKDEKRANVRRPKRTAAISRPLLSLSVRPNRLLRTMACSAKEDRQCRKVRAATVRGAHRTPRATPADPAPPKCRSTTRTGRRCAPSKVGRHHAAHKLGRLVHAVRRDPSRGGAEPRIPSRPRRACFLPVPLVFGALLSASARLSRREKKKPRLFIPVCGPLIGEAAVACAPGIPGSRTETRAAERERLGARPLGPPQNCHPYFTARVDVEQFRCAGRQASS